MSPRTALEWLKEKYGILVFGSIWLFLLFLFNGGWQPTIKFMFGHEASNQQREQINPNIRYPIFEAGPNTMQRFGNYPCEGSCGGHKAGYDWAMTRKIYQETDCRGKSRSFLEGCLAYVKEQEDEVLADELKSSRGY